MRHLKIQIEVLNGMCGILNVPQCVLTGNTCLLLCQSGVEYPTAVQFFRLTGVFNILVLSTDHELITERNASLEAMHGYASGSNASYYPTRKHSPLEERNYTTKWTAGPGICTIK
jgi:hypothetical protein